MDQQNETQATRNDELDDVALDEIVGGIDTVPLPESPVAIGTWPTPERTFYYPRLQDFSRTLGL